MLEIGLYSAVAPLILLLLSTIWRYPAVLEEVVKWGILKMGKSSDRSPSGMQGSELGNGVVVGLVFGLSEAVLFSTNAWMSGDWRVMGMRLLLTVPMHTLTSLIISVGMKYGVGWVGLVFAMIIHATFNYVVS